MDLKEVPESLSKRIEDYILNMGNVGFNCDKMQLFKESFPELYYLELDKSFPTRNLMDYVIRFNDAKGFVIPFYSQRILAFEFEKDKTFFLLKYGS